MISVGQNEKYTNTKGRRKKKRLDTYGKMRRSSWCCCAEGWPLLEEEKKNPSIEDDVGYKKEDCRMKGDTLWKENDGAEQPPNSMYKKLAGKNLIDTPTFGKKKEKKKTFALWTGRTSNVNIRVIDQPTQQQQCHYFRISLVKKKKNEIASSCV